MSTQEIILATQDILDQGLTLLSTMDPQLYAQVADEPFAASVGGHYRHVLDHFLCVAAGMAGGSIDYDHRTRDRELETRKASAEHMTGLLMKSFQTLGPQELNQPCEVVYRVGYSTDGPTRIATTVARELAFCVSHAVHHFAIMKLICAHLSVPVTADFGVAPSTLRYRSAQAAS